MTKNRPLILVVNDDGIESDGIAILSSVMREIGEVFVVAPDINRSGLSHAMTLNKDIYIENIHPEKIVQVVIVRKDQLGSCLPIIKKSTGAIIFF